MIKSEKILTDQGSKYKKLVRVINNNKIIQSVDDIDPKTHVKLRPKIDYTKFTKKVQDGVSPRMVVEDFLRYHEKSKKTEEKPINPQHKPKFMYKKKEDKFYN